MLLNLKFLVQCFVDHYPFVLFLLAILLSVILRLMSSDYHFGIFNVSYLYHNIPQALQ